MFPLEKKEKDQRQDIKRKFVSITHHVRYNFFIKYIQKFTYLRPVFYLIEFRLLTSVNFPISIYYNVPLKIYFKNRLYTVFTSLI